MSAHMDSYEYRGHWFNEHAPPHLCSAQCAATMIKSLSGFPLSAETHNVLVAALYTTQPADESSTSGLTRMRLKHLIGQAAKFHWKYWQYRNEEERRSGRDTDTERDNERETCGWDQRPDLSPDADDVKSIRTHSLRTQLIHCVMNTTSYAKCNCNLNVCFLKVLSKFIKCYFVIGNHSGPLNLNKNQMRTFE